MKKICLLFITLTFLVGCSPKDAKKQDLSYQKLLSSYKSNYIQSLTPDDPITYYISATTNLKKLDKISSKKVDRTLNNIIKDYKRTIELDPTFSPAYYGLGVAYTKQEDFEKAEEAFNIAAKLNPGLVEYQLSASVLCDKNKHYDCAIKKYIQIMQIDPENSDAYIYLADLLFKKGDYKRASKLFKSVLRNDENNEIAKAALEEIKRKSFNVDDKKKSVEDNAEEIDTDNKTEELSDDKPKIKHKKTRANSKNK